MEESAKFLRVHCSELHSIGAMAVRTCRTSLLVVRLFPGGTIPSLNIKACWCDDIRSIIEKVKLQGVDPARHTKIESQPINRVSGAIASPTIGRMQVIPIISIVDSRDG